MAKAVSDEAPATAEATVDREAMERAFAKIKAAREQAANRAGRPTRPRAQAVRAAATRSVEYLKSQ